MNETTVTESSATQQAAAEERHKPMNLIGSVSATKMDKTIVVRVERTARHPLYHKIIRHRKKFYVHDENNEASVGDKVEIAATRPMSKLKRWRLVRILDASAG